MENRERLSTRICSPDGPLDAQICFIGQAPGATEDYKGIPFQGAAGKLLDRVIHSVGMARSMVLVNNVFAQRPPDNKVDYFFSDKSNTKLTWEGEEHVATLKYWLEGLLERRNSGLGGPNILVALGRESMMILTGKKRIDKWRGSVLPCTLVPGFKVYPTYHPSFVNRLMNEPEERLQGMKKTMQQNALPLFHRDLERVKEQSYSPEFSQPKREFKIVNTFEEAIFEIEKMNREASYVSCDIETLKGIDGPIVWCIGFSPSPDYAVCIPILKNRKLRWTPPQEAQIWQTISRLFLNPSIVKVFQNGSYDLSVLGRYYGLRLAEGTFGDTMVLHQHTYPFLRKGLEVLTSIYTWENYYKDDGKVWEGKRISDLAEFEYNCRDCCVTREIFPIISRDSSELRILDSYERSMSVFPSLLFMQIRGVKINVEQKARLSEVFSQNTKKAAQLVNLLAGQSINLNSSTQLNALVYGRYQMPIQTNHKTGRPCLDKDARNRLLKKFPNKNSEKNQLIQAISDFKKYDKLRSTYTDMIIDSDGRVRTSYTWISTLRLSSSESHFGTGGNLQNIPIRSEEGRMVRKLFIPDEGKILLHSDLAQAEAREVAWAARDEELIDKFLTLGYDVHWFRAKMIFSLPKDLPYHKEEEISCPYLDEPKPMKFYRDIGKTVVHAFNYKMGYLMLQTILIREGVFLAQSVCRQLLETTRRTNPLTLRWQQSVIEQVKAYQMLETPLGDKRIFRGRQNDSLWRSAIAYVPQSTVGRIIQLGIQAIYEEMPKYEILLNVHDEVGGQCSPQDVNSSMYGIKERLEITHEVGGRDLTIPCDFKASATSWGDLKELELGEYKPEIEEAEVECGEKG